MKIVIAAIASLALPVCASVAQPYSPAGAGALAGRSPHQNYVSQTAATPTCGKAMHSIPAGKLPTYGTHALPSAACAPAELASAESPIRTAHD